MNLSKIYNKRVNLKDPASFPRTNSFAMGRRKIRKRSSKKST